jgi:drug/metabolite transporter (DMT)-like permease
MIGSDGVDPLTATVIRAIFGGAAFWIISAVRGHLPIIIRKGKDIRSMALIAGGAVIGAVLGVWLSMVAIKLAPIGIASTLMALMPVTILPITAIVYKERVSWRAIVGAIIACLGVAVLFQAN